MTLRRILGSAGSALVLLGCTGPEGPGGQEPVLPGSLLVSVSTAGATLDSDGYTVSLDGVEVEAVGLHGAVEIAEVDPGEHAVALTGVADNCSVAPPLPSTIVVAAAVQTTASFAVRCDSLLRNVIVFDRVRNLTSAIYWISPEGSPPQHIIEGSSPTLSPDGRRLAYTRWDAGTISIWRAKVDGTAIEPLTLSPHVNQMPRWSPDGQRIAFVSDRDGNFEIYTMRADGSDQRRVTHDPAQDHGPVWSPDGTRLAFTRTLDPPGNSEVFVANADGTEEMNVTRHSGGDEVQDWAPNGQHLLINSARDLGLSNDLYRIDMDGANATNLTNHEAFDGQAALSPAGDAFVFVSERDDHHLSLYRADADGQGVVRLTNPDTDAWDGSPTWIP